jgi:hypothetical protein
MKKKRVLLLIVLSLAFSIISCGGGWEGDWSYELPTPYDEPKTPPPLPPTLSAWVIETVDTACGTCPNSIATDSSNNVHIIYVDCVNGIYNIKYATNSSGSWITETVDSIGDIVIGMNWNISIAVDSSNNVHISYYDVTNNDLKYATNSSGSWVTEIVNSGEYGGKYNSIATDSLNNVHISYLGGYQNYELKYATNSSGSWVTETVDSGESFLGEFNSIAIDSLNNVHISYFGGYPNYDLKHATNFSGLWVTETIDSVGSVGWNTSIAIDSSDHLHISYYDGTNNDLKYATNSSGSWVNWTVEKEGNTGIGHTSIAIDSVGNVHIICYSGIHDAIIYAMKKPSQLGSWVIETVDNVGHTGLGYWYSSIATDSLNNVHISYVAGYPNYGLKHAVKQSEN